MRVRNRKGSQASRRNRRGTDQLTGLGGANGMAEGEPLGIFAAELVKLDRVRFGLRPFRDDFHAEIMRQRHNGAQNDGSRARTVLANEGSIDLDGVERE